MTQTATPAARTFDKIQNGRYQVMQDGKPVGVVQYESAYWWAYDLQGDRIPVTGGYASAQEAAAQIPAPAVVDTRPLPGQPAQPISQPISQPVRYTSEREIDREVARIAQLGQHDYEAAHAAADDLVREVLEVISGQHAQYAYLAVAVLKVYELDFPRHMA